MYSETRDKRINYYLKLSAIILILLSAVFVLTLSGGLSRYFESNAAKKTITVSGYAEMEMVPDIRTLSISIVGKGKDEKLAQADAAVKSKSVSDFLKSQKIDDKDIKSQNISTYPEYKNDCPVTPYDKATSYYRPCDSVISGYATTQSVEVTLRKDSMDKAADIVAQLTSKGITVQTGEATVENPEKIQAELRAKAITDARENAEKLADALDVDLGKVESFNENSGGYYPMMAKGAAMMSADAVAAPAPVISNGTQKISTTVSVSFEIH